MPTYKVIFLGLAVAGLEEESRLIAGLQKKFNLSPEKAERLLQRVPIVVKKAVSREEMEKYVKAFEEIGGKTRVEEQEKEFLKDQEPRTDAEADDARKVVTREKGEKAYEGPAREIPPEEKPLQEKPLPAWEARGGFIGSFFSTTGEALFSPSKFFKKVAGGRGYWAPLIYGVICGVIGGGMTVLWWWLFASGFLRVYLPSDIPFFNVAVLVAILAPILALLPFAVAFTILIGSAITHLGVMIVGGNKRRFGATFRALSYAFSGHLFGIIPCIGVPIGLIYSFVLTIFGVRGGQEMSAGKATLAILISIILAVGLSIAAAVSLPFIIGSSIRLGGIKI